MNARKENWFIPSDFKLRIKVKPVQANGNRPRDPANAANGAGVHIRFKNDIASWIIKTIRVKPKGMHDIEVISPYMSFEESLRSDLQTSKEEKEHPELLYTRGYDPKLNYMYNPHKDKCGFAKAAEKIVDIFEDYQFDWIPIIIKPSVMDYVVEIDLQVMNLC